MLCYSKKLQQSLSLAVRGISVSLALRQGSRVVLEHHEQGPAVLLDVVLAGRGQGRQQQLAWGGQIFGVRVQGARCRGRVGPEGSPQGMGTFCGKPFRGFQLEGRGLHFSEGLCV